MFIRNIRNDKENLLISGVCKLDELFFFVPNYLLNI